MIKNKKILIIYYSNNTNKLWRKLITMQIILYKILIFTVKKLLLNKINLKNRLNN